MSVYPGLLDLQSGDMISDAERRHPSIYFCLSDYKQCVIISMFKFPPEQSPARPPQSSGSYESDGFVIIYRSLTVFGE